MTYQVEKTSNQMTYQGEKSSNQTRNKTVTVPQIPNPIPIAPAPQAQDFVVDEEVVEDEQITEEEEENPIKCCCRFCGEIKEINFPVKNLDLIGIDVEKFMNFMDLSVEFNDFLSEIVCEDCFNQISPIAMLKTQYKKAENKMLQELGIIEEVLPDPIEDICEEYLDNDGEFQETTDYDDSLINECSKPNSSASSFTKVAISTKNVSDKPPPAKKQKIKTTTKIISKRTLEFECNLCNNVSFYIGLAIIYVNDRGR